MKPSSRFCVDLRPRGGATARPLAAILGVRGVRPTFLRAAALSCGGRGLESPGGILEALEEDERVVVVVNARTCCCCLCSWKPSGGERESEETTGAEGNRART